jgi:hypothetical protein
MTQENLMKILKFSNSGSFLGFLGILRNPEDSTRNWWGRVKTSNNGTFQINSRMVAMVNMCWYMLRS